MANILRFHIVNNIYKGCQWKSSPIYSTLKFLARKITKDKDLIKQDYNKVSNHTFKSNYMQQCFLLAGHWRLDQRVAEKWKCWPGEFVIMFYNFNATFFPQLHVTVKSLTNPPSCWAFLMAMTAPTISLLYPPLCSFNQKWWKRSSICLIFRCWFCAITLFIFF